MARARARVGGARARSEQLVELRPAADRREMLERARSTLLRIVASVRCTT